MNKDNSVSCTSRKDIFWHQATVAELGAKGPFGDQASAHLVPENLFSISAAFL